MPSRSLEGLKTDSGWTIERRLSEKLQSGGNHCVRYSATSSEGKSGFLKAMDFSRARNVDDVNNLSAAYIFEREVLERCKNRNMSKVVIALDHGEISVPGFPEGIGSTVYYIIFEVADEGDFRQKHLDSFNNSVQALFSRFKALHHVCLGLEQLHGAGLAHEDIKPSNILCFEGGIAKVSDLGQVTDYHGRSPFSGADFTGDPHYIPINLRCGDALSEFEDRFATDLYMAGSMAYHIVEQIQITTVLMDEILQIAPHFWTLPYLERLPYMITAYNAVIQRFGESIEIRLGADLAESISNMVYEMCYPDPKQRGNKKFAKKFSRYSMRRYVSKCSRVVRLLKNSSSN